MMGKLEMLILMVMIALSLGCGGGGAESPSADELTVRGRLTDVKAASLLEVESITVETETGESFLLEADNRIFSGFTYAPGKSCDSDVPSGGRTIGVERRSGL